MVVGIPVAAVRRIVDAVLAEGPLHPLALVLILVLLLLGARDHVPHLVGRALEAPGGLVAPPGAVGAIGAVAARAASRAVLHHAPALALAVAPLLHVRVRRGVAVDGAGGLQGVEEGSDSKVGFWVGFSRIYPGRRLSPSGHGGLSSDGQDRTLETVS